MAVSAPESPRTTSLPAGLAPAEVQRQRQRFGPNILTSPNQHRLWSIIRGIVTEPMFVLLVLTAGVYLLIGSRSEAYVLLVATALVAGISFYQEARSDRALQALQQLTQPLARVWRSGQEAQIPAEEIVVDDILLVAEGEQVGADGLLLEAHDLQTDESFLTGESQPVTKAADGVQLLYAGSSVSGGTGVVRVSAVGSQTRLGLIGGLMQQVNTPPTPLQQQVRAFVRRMALVGATAFVMVWSYNWWESGSFVHGLLHGLTIAMAVLPEEIPVALSSFMALGAWRLMRQRILTKQPQTVETLGSATVICVDKTGTLTQNRMALSHLYCPTDAAGPQPFVLGQSLSSAASQLLETAMWASEPQPFDPMEQALHLAYAATAAHDERPAYTLVHEYPLGGHPPIMTHIFANAVGQRLVACKGAPEGIIARCHLPAAARAAALATLEELATTGLRVLGVAQCLVPPATYPADQEEFAWEFVGLVAFTDPPKPGTAAVLQQFYGAGLQVKMITGDNAVTAAAIARQIGLRHPEPVLSGAEVLQLSPAALRQRVPDVDLYARMFPEAKLRVVEALKANGAVVAMTGDGINDGPALKAAHIGVAMGQRGTELARQAAALILLDDELSGMVTAVGFGRKIYDNLKKAVQYIIAIHIPLILTVLVPSLLAWQYPVLLGPVHVILLELLMGPTCSIVFENEPMEADTLQRPPRVAASSFLQLRELGSSLVQGLVIAAGVLGVAAYAQSAGYSETLTRTLTFTTLLLANVLLTLVSRSRRHTLLTTLRYHNALLPLMLGLTLLLLALCLTIPALQQLFQLQPLTGRQLALCSAVALASTGWFEVYKALRHSQSPNNKVA
ncbi:Ca2+-transporting ATPase [Hymenobacter gelipurpurascens]|uniref:Ca2+-transporting ATPase n=1 Tax=Hymenobacter gelipurpurascens TaxID=89968 RepID=A0A212TKN7_9BACT|nr:cation-translocating P-type ATPase [Hymenobacter gelipurpurascens]SNC66535.1 Ca2+-transporting ATPase [Hymenobacter gelipurpurascens]